MKQSNSFYGSKITLFSILILFSIKTSFGQQKPDAVAIKVKQLLAKMTLDEKAAQTMCLSGEWYINSNNQIDTQKLAKAVKYGIGQMRDHFKTSEKNSVQFTNFIQKYVKNNTRLGIPVIIHGEGLHGYVNDNATSFPQAIALSSTWNPGLLEKICAVTAHEARSRGVQQLLSPILDIARDPRWGRFSETYGEDPYLTGELGVSAIKGYQGANTTISSNKNVIATLKHFPGSATTVGGLNVAPMVTSERDFREIFCYPFKQVIKRANPLSVMAFYGEYDGIPTHTNTHLLRNILRKEMGFKGIVVSDYGALKLLTQGWQWEFNRHQVAVDSADAARLALTAGVNIEMVAPECFPAIPDLVRTGKLPIKILNDAVAEILTLKFNAGLFDKIYASEDEAIQVSNNPESKKLALQAALQGIVMLKNDKQVLPINPTITKTIAVIGPNANEVILGDYSTFKPKYFETVLNGITKRAEADKIKVLYAQGCKITAPLPEFAAQLKADSILVKEAVKTALQADIVVLALGGNIDTDREGRDRSGLTMLGLQYHLIDEVLKTGKPVVLCLFGGKLYAMPEVYKKVQATFLCWNLGQETGNALAQTLFGDNNPSGKLTVSIPVSEGHLPVYYNKKPSAYGRSYYYEDYIGGAIYPFGYGLSYTNFEVSNVAIAKSNIAINETVKVFATVTNTGDKDGATVLQMYVRDIVSSVTRPLKQLKDFKRIFLRKGETAKVEFTITPEKLAFYNRDMKFMVEAGDFEVMVGTSSLDKDLQKLPFTVISKK